MSEHSEQMRYWVEHENYEDKIRIHAQACNIPYLIAVDIRSDTGLQVTYINVQEITKMNHLPDIRICVQQQKHNNGGGGRLEKMMFR